MTSCTAKQKILTLKGTCRGEGVV